MENETAERAALGRVACIGDLYDARRDNFCGISIFKKSVPQTALSSTDAHFSDIRLLHSDDFSEKFSKLDVKAELSVSVLAGLFTLEGSARYLNDQKTSARTVKSSLVYNVKTKDEQVNVYHEDLKDAFAIDAIESGMATHVVTGISWGANSVLSCIYENRDNKDVKEIEGNLSAQMKKVSLAISGKASVDFCEGDNNKGISFDVRVYGDIVPTNEDLPTTFEGALELMKQLPRLVGNSNDGKGKPLVYRMIPISLLKEYLDFQMKTDSTLKSLEEASLTRVIHLFDQIARAQQKINDFHQDALDFKECVPVEDVVRISSLKEAMAIEEASLRSKLSTLLTEVRSGKRDAAELEDLIREFQSSEHSPLNIETILTTWGPLVEKINLARTLIQNGVKYIGLGVSLDDEILKDFESKAVVFYFTQESKSLDMVRWKGNRQIFFQEVKKNMEGYRYFVVDCDIHPNLMPNGHTSCVQILQSGQVLTEDLFEVQGKLSNVSWVQSISDPERLVHYPNKLVPLKISCTGNNCNPTRKYDWRCRKCGKQVEYGFDQNIYCKCGKIPAICLEFKCSDPKHGINFERHGEAYFLQLLDELRPFEELNILILGETGVGKSTWINGFINFLTYDSLEEAEAGELCTLIPSEFTVCDENFDEITVKTGEDKNETLKAGQSATQDAKVYPFQLGNTTIRLIDTPGIGDTRGIDQDKKNFQNILGTLSYLDEIHGICILLKPNNARLTVMFRFCIKELLTYLHRDASKNIVFCFTNSRGTFYRPGDTMPALKALLKENKDVEIVISQKTVYCYDSEAYRFLAAVKNDPPVTFDDSEKGNFANSWEKSIAETKRMLKYISSLKPHPIQSTLNLNTARELVLSLTRPLAEITKNIQTNKELLKRTLEMIESTDADIKKLEKLRWTKRTVLKNTKIGHPKTVCANPNCAKVWTVDGLTMTQYVKECHNPCGLSGVTADSLGNPGLLNCWAMNGNTCRICGHSYREHLHSYYDSHEEIVDVEDESVKSALEQGLDGKKMKKNMITNKNNEIKKLEDEQKEIENASAKFACFLKRNAITAYNDGMEKYLKHLIREEEERVAVSGDKVRLEGLRASLASYIEEKRILETEMQKGDSGSFVLTPEEIQEVVKKLKGLKAGESLEQALDCVNRTKKVVYREAVISQPKSHKKKGFMSKIGEGISKLGSIFS